MRPRLLFKAPVTTASGYGVHSRQLLKSLLASDLYDVSVKPLSWGQTSFLTAENDSFISVIEQLISKHENDVRTNSTRYDISVQVTIPNEFEKLADVNVGVTAGIETDIASPEWILKINKMVDVLFVPSTHSRDVLLNSRFIGQDGSELVINKTPIVAHEAVDTTEFNTSTTHHLEHTGDFDIGPEFNFLFVGLGLDKGYGEDRKNVALLAKWFCETFAGREDVGLVLKLGMVNNSLMDFERVKASLHEIKKQTGCGEFPRLTLIHGRLSDRQLAALYRHPKVKVMISLTHGEGFGLPLLEAAACGLPVMATNWSGHLDFLRVDGKKTFVELDYDLTPIPDTVVWNGVIEKGSRWACVKEEDVRLKMRKVVASYDKPKQWATELAEHVATKFNEHVTGWHFVTELDKAVKLHMMQNPRSKEQAITLLRGQLLGDRSTDRKTLLYTMPMSAGDVFISTAVVNSLKKRYADHDIYFATNAQYKSILEGNPDIHKVIQYQEWMMDISLCEAVFDMVFTPNINIQMTFSNWVHGGKGRRLADEMAVHCGVELGDYHIEMKKPSVELPERYITVHPGSGKGQWEARNYIHWQEVISNLTTLSELPVVLVGAQDDACYNDVIDIRGKTADYRELAGVIADASLHVGIDSVTMHMAAALGVDHVALFGSSYANSTGPVNKSNIHLSVLMETPTRYSCDKACYKYQCSVDKDHPCINEINPRDVVRECLVALGSAHYAIERYKEHRPTISGYTHVFDADTGGYPYIQSITSMLGFCDEVVVIDGGSTDGTVEKIRAIGDDRVKIYERKWDWEEPGMDGMQKAFGRAMCNGQFLWQMDVDEVVHEDDYEKIRKLAKRFPRDVNLVHLPVVELWGDARTVRSDRHSWKWRLSRNDFKITHGIAKHARLFDEKTGKTYAKKGASDGCEYIDLMTHEYIPHKGFYTQEIEHLRLNSPQEYGKLMNQLFCEMPVVYHYSWADIGRKVRNFKKFWNKSWSRLYNDASPEDRFPDVVDDQTCERRVAAMKEQGGEHAKAETFTLDRTNPKVMEEWISEIR